MVSGQAGNGDLELSPRPHFYGGSLGVSSLLLVPVPSAARAIDLYRRGDLDVAQVGDAQYRALSSRPDFHGSSSLDGYYALPPPSRVDEFESSLNRDELARVIGPALSPLDAIVPPAVPDYVASSLSSDSPLFGSATPPAPVTLEPSRPRDWAIGALRRALELQWPARRHAGAAVRLVHITSVVPDPAVWLRVALPQTRSRWYRDVLATGAERTNDPVTRMSSYGTAESWALQKGLVIPLASGNIGFLIKPDVSGLQVTPLGLMPENNNWPSVTLT
jgi:hypothetical protein